MTTMIRAEYARVMLYFDTGEAGQIQRMPRFYLLKTIVLQGKGTNMADNPSLENI